MKPPKLPAPPAPPIDHDAEREPASDIELLGAMLTDNVTMGILLRELPYERTHYRSNLRMVAGAAIRIRKGCEKLLGETDPRAEQLATLEPGPTVAAGHSSVVPAEPAATPAPSESTRKRSASDPPQLGKNGRAYTVVESFIMAELKDRGTATTAELLKFMAEERRVPTAEVNDALANLRIAKVISTTRLGEGFINRIAE